MLLDSNAIIGAANGTLPGILTLLTRRRCATASVVRIEVYGFVDLRGEELQALDLLFKGLTVFALEDRVVECAIALRRMRKMRLGDAIIAATALVHELPLVTRNLADFQHIADLELIHPLTGLE